MSVKIDDFESLSVDEMEDKLEEMYLIYKKKKKYLTENEKKNVLKNEVNQILRLYRTDKKCMEIIKLIHEYEKYIEIMTNTFNKWVNDNRNTFTDSRISICHSFERDFIIRIPKELDKLITSENLSGKKNLVYVWMYLYPESNNIPEIVKRQIKYLDCIDGDSNFTRELFFNGTVWNLDLIRKEVKNMIE